MDTRNFTLEKALAPYDIGLTNILVTLDCEDQTYLLVNSEHIADFHLDASNAEINCGFDIEIHS